METDHGKQLSWQLLCCVRCTMEGTRICPALSWQPNAQEEAAPAPSANGTAAKEDKVKGLPSLGPKPKGSAVSKKEAAAAN